MSAFSAHNDPHGGLCGGSRFREHAQGLKGSLVKKNPVVNNCKDKKYGITESSSHVLRRGEDVAAEVVADVRFN
jgi:hypothetical protein